MAEDFIQSFSGKAVTFLNPQESQIEINDIAHALSLLCRFGGHCKKFYSVAQHSVYCAQQAEPRFKLEALLHDATEAYIVDMPRPIKSVLNGYLDIEAGLDRVIRKKYNLPEKMSAVVHLIDNRMLATERRDLMNPSDEKWLELPNPYDFKIEVKPPEVAFEEFMTLYNEIMWGYYD